MIRRLMDISGIPFVVEEREDGLYAVGIKVRKRMIKFEGSGLPVDIENKILGSPGDGKINGIEEIESLLEGMPENTKLKDELLVDDVQSGIEDALGFSLDTTEETETSSV